MISRFSSVTASPSRLRNREVRACWQVVVVAVSAAMSVTFACIAPFPALAALASRTLSARAATVTLLAAVLANQAVGFCVLGYPRTLETAIWGPVLALGTLTAFVVARRIAQPVLAVVAAFGAYEAVLAITSLVWQHSLADFSLAILGQVAFGNAVGLVVLGIAYLLMVAIERAAAPDGAEAAVS
jgi:hypothetical protein